MRNKAHHASSASDASASPFSAVERVCFVLLLAILAARPLIPEVFERQEITFLVAVGVHGGVGPETTVWIDTLLLILAAPSLIRAMTRQQPFAWRLATAAIVAGFLLSTLAAGNQRLALNAGANLLVIAAAGAALAQYVRAPWAMQVALAALLATGATSAFKSYLQVYKEFPETLQMWQEQRKSLAASGYDSPEMENFERRMRSGEAFAFLSHSNVAGSCMMMACIVAVGTMCAAARGGGTRDARQTGAVLGAMLVVMIGLGVWWTHSEGAIIAGLCGLVMLAALGLRQTKIAQRPALALTLFSAAYLMVIACGVAYGLSKGTLPHPSLAFRWHYWTAAADTMVDAPLTGVGRENFAASYLLHKPADSPEDVRNPHNIWVTALAETGPLGFVGAVLAVGLCLLTGLRRLSLPSENFRPADPWMTPTWLVAPAFGVLLVAAIFGETHFETRAWAALWLFEVAGTWSLSYIVAHLALARGLAEQRARGWIMAGVIAALGAVLIHNLICFSLTTPAGLAIFIMLTAVAVGGGAGDRMNATDAARRPTSWTSTIAVVLLIVLHLSVVTLPTSIAGLYLRHMRAALASAASTEQIFASLDYGRAAIAADPLDPQIPRDTARMAIRAAASLPLSEFRVKVFNDAERFAQQSLERQPGSFSTRRMLAQLSEQREELFDYLARPDEAVAAMKSAADHWNVAAALDPTDPRVRISAGRACVRMWEEFGDARHAEQAVEHFCEALRIDALRPPQEVMRLRNDDIEAVHAALDQLAEAGFYDALPPSVAPRKP